MAAWLRPSVESVADTASARFRFNKTAPPLKSDSTAQPCPTTQEITSPMNNPVGLVTQSWTGSRVLLETGGPACPGPADVPTAHRTPPSRTAVTAPNLGLLTT